MSVAAADETVDRRGGTGGAYAGVPRPFRWVLAFPLSPWWLGAAAAAAYLLTGIFALLAGAPRWPGGGGTLELAYALWFAWVPIAVAYLVRGTERDALELAPILGVEAHERETLCREALSVAPRAVWIGVAIGLLMTGFALAVGFGILDAEPSRSELAYVLVRELTIEIAVFGVLGWGVGAAIRLSRLTAERARPDPLDRSAFAPLVRNGSRLALLWLVANAIGLPTALLPPASLDAGAAEIVISLTLVLACLAVGALLISTHGARRAIRAAKDAELLRVRSEIAEARRAREDERLPGLLAWEGHVEARAEWPIDAAALRRVGLYLLIPLGSWLGGAVVERLLSAALD